jgi:hypothetical protein
MAGQTEAALLCLPPTPLAPTVNKLTGEVTLWWQPQMAVTSYTIEVYSGSGLTPIKTYTVDGKTNTWVIPDADLACGNYQYRVKAECCDERCDSCASQFNPKLDYCSNMATLWNTPCGCTDPDYPTGVQYSFSLLCSDGSRAGYICADGSPPSHQLPYPYCNCANGLPPDEYGLCNDKVPPEPPQPPQFRNCPLGSPVFGCNWECSPMTHYEPKVCGSEYEVACGQGPNKQLVSGPPTYNRCSIKDPTGWQFNDQYLIDPPGVSEELPPLLYQWKCGAGLKISEQCFACRRAECGPPQGKSFQGALPEDQLCLDDKGQPTGELRNLTPTAEGWIWDCVGNDKCNTPTMINKNWVYVWNGETKDPTPNTWEQLDKCWATTAACGQANGGFYVRENFATKSTAKDFLCRGGKAVSPYPGGHPYDEITYSAERDFNKLISDRMVWQCVYNQGTPEEAKLDCEAYVVGCRSDITGNDYTKGSFDSLTAVPAPANLCYNGKDDNANDSQVTLGGPTDRLAPPGWDWTCSDTHGGTAKCQANLVDCKTPPHDREYKDEQEVMAQAPLCTAGESMDFIATDTGWTWNCVDDIKGQAKCQARLLKCLTPPNTGVYESWQDLADKTGANCTGTTNTRTCTGVCSNKDSKISVTFANGQWSWTCGSDKCSAKEINCQEPPDKGAYADWTDLLAVPGVSCSGTGDSRLCKGICTDKDAEKTVDYNPATSQFAWTCGAKKCASQPMGCGNFTAQLHAYSEFKDYQIDPHGGIDKEAICLGNGEPVWYNAYPGETGFTPWGLGEWSNNNPFVDHDASDGRYKEGTWLWQCKYGEKILPATGATNNVYKNEKDGQIYCYVWDKGVCGDVLDNKPENNNKFTFNEINAMAGDSQTRGNKSAPPLCARGIVFYDINGLGDVNGNPLLEKRWHCEGGSTGSNLPQDHCGYWCEDGMLKGKRPCDNIDVTGCATPPYGISYLDETAFTNVFKDWATEGTNGCEKFNDGRTLASTDRTWNPDTCQWTWNCGGMGCYANKTKAALTATLTGPVPDTAACSADENNQTVKAETNCSQENTQITWKITSPSGRITTVTDDGTGIYKFTAMGLYNLFDPKETGVYSISYHLVCNDKCLLGDIKEKDAGPVTFTVEQDKDQKGSKLTVDKETICAGDSVTFTATADSGCKFPAFTWATCDSNPTANTCQNQYNNAGTYSVDVTIKCGGCFKDWSDSQQVIVKDKPTLNDILGKDNFCSKVPESYTTTANNCDAGTITWALTDKNGQTIGEIDDVKNANYTPPTDLDSGDYTLAATLNCTDPCAATDLKSKVITIEDSPTAKVGTITVVPPSPICSDVDYKLTVSEARCTDGSPATIEWFENEALISGASGLTYTVNKSVTTPTDFSYAVKVTCGQDPCSDTATSTPKIVTVNPKPDFVSLDGPLEFCSATPPQYTAVTTCSAGTVDFEMIDESTGLPVSGSAESVSIINFNAKYTPKPQPLNPVDGRGTYTVRATMHCTNPCEATKILEVNKVEVYSCVCGSANDKYFVGETDNTLSLGNINPPYVFCKPGCSVVPETPLNLKGDGWTWECRCGGLPLVTGCEAKQTKCGPASSEANGQDRYYVDASWNDPAARGSLCTNASSTIPDNPLAIDTGTGDEAGTDSTKCNGGIKDTWKWKCADSVGGSGHELDCSAKRLDCGIANAQRVLDNGCAIQPHDATDGYRGSYDKDIKDGKPAGVPTEHRCNWSNFTTGSGYEDTTRGKWWWECEDSLEKTVQCEARRDCGWGVRNDNGNGDNSEYSTVDYGTAGCWTAEDVGMYNNNSETAMVWGRATRYKFPGSEADACSGSAYWSVCKKAHCAPLANVCNVKGVCPDEYTVPSDVQWDNLEKALSISNCNRNLTNLSDGYICPPAGNDGDIMPDPPGDDGLKDKITFNGLAGAGYWTSSSKNSNPWPNAFCTSSSNCQKTLPYYELNNINDKKVGRDAGSGDNTSCTVYSDGTTNCLPKQVRCIKPFAGYGSAGGGGGEKQCYGWGCGLSQ